MLGAEKIRIKKEKPLASGPLKSNVVNCHVGGLAKSLGSISEIPRNTWNRKCPELRFEEILFC